MTYIKGSVPYTLTDISPCGECDGLDCDKCSYSKEEEDTDNKQYQMQREDESNQLPYPWFR
jgi:hypothetical protein